MLRRDVGRFLVEPQDVYDYDNLRLLEKQLRMTDFFIATPAEVKAGRSSLPTHTKDQLWLNKFEFGNKIEYEKMLDTKRPNAPHETQSFVLGQNPARSFTASTDGVFNTFTSADKSVWLRGPARRLTAKEKFCAHGFAVTPELASALGTPVAWLAHCINVIFIQVLTHAARAMV